MILRSVLINIRPREELIKYAVSYFMKNFEHREAK